MSMLATGLWHLYFVRPGPDMDDIKVEADITAFGHRLKAHRVRTIAMTRDQAARLYQRLTTKKASESAAVFTAAAEAAVPAATTEAAAMPPAVDTTSSQPSPEAVLQEASAPVESGSVEAEAAPAVIDASSDAGPDNTPSSDKQPG